MADEARAGQRAADVKERRMNVCPAFAPDAQPPEAPAPREHPLDHTSVPDEALVALEAALTLDGRTGSTVTSHMREPWTLAPLITSAIPSEATTR